MTFDQLPATVANDTVRAVEDTFEAHVIGMHAEFTGDQGPAMVRTFLELGWRPPATSDGVLDELVDSYKAKASQRKQAYLDGGESSALSDWRYYAGLVEGLRIARRTARPVTP